MFHVHCLFHMCVEAVCLMSQLKYVRLFPDNTGHLEWQNTQERMQLHVGTCIYFQYVYIC